MYPFHPVADAQHPFVPNEINQRQFSAPYSPPLTQLVFWKVCCDFFLLYFPFVTMSSYVTIQIRLITV